MEPCKQACTPEQYAAEARGGEGVLRYARREHAGRRSARSASEASAEMEFEQAAALHAQWQKVKAAAALAD